MVSLTSKAKPEELRAEDPPRTADFSISPAPVVWNLSGCLVLLLLLHVFVLTMNYGFGHDHMYGLSEIFNFGVEHSVPTLFATLSLLICALCFLLLYKAGEPGSHLRRVWMVLTLSFAFVTVDEYAVLHERLIRPVRDLFGFEGFLYFAWVLPYAIAAALLGAYVLPALWKLGRKYRLLFGSAAAFYLFGAIGVEMLGARYYESVNEQVDLTYRLYQTLEEVMEHTGVLILIYTLLDLLRYRVGGVRLRFA